MARYTKDKKIYLLILPHFLLFFIFFAVPVIWCVYLSFFKYNLFEKQFILFANYITLLTNHPLFIKSLKNTFFYAVIFVPLWMIKGIVLSGIIQVFGQRLKTFFKASFYLPHVTSAVVISMVWLWFYNPEIGLFNHIITALGFSKISWLGDPEIAMLSIIFMQILISGGASVVIFAAAIESIPKSIFEAAEIDGASKIRIYFQITLPLIKPVLSYQLIIGLIGSFQVFSNIYVMTKGGPQFSTLTVLYLIYETAFETYDFGLAAAQSVILAVLIGIISVIQMKIFSDENKYDFK